MIISSLLTLLFVNFAVCRRTPFQVKSEFEALSKRQSVPSSQPAIPLPPYMCQLTLVGVRLSKDVWPTHVQLSRCMGAVYTVGPFECGASKVKRLNVSAYTRRGSTFTGLTTVSLTNHTECGTQCIKKRKKSCNQTTHEFNNQTCQCNCRDNYDQCGPGKYWDKNDCRCKCSQIQPCIGYESTKIWSNKVCKCECRKILVKKCLASGNGKILRPDTCACVCPQKLCPKGTVVDPTDCQCKI